MQLSTVGAKAAFTANIFAGPGDTRNLEQAQAVNSALLDAQAEPLTLVSITDNIEDYLWYCECHKGGPRLRTSTPSALTPRTPDSGASSSAMPEVEDRDF